MYTNDRDTINIVNGAMVIPIPKFFEAINARDAHALSLVSLVQELNCKKWKAIGFLRDTFEKIFSSLGVTFQNLTKLSMERCFISSVIMEQLGRLVQLESLHTLCCKDDTYVEDNLKLDNVSCGALSNLKSLHTLKCVENWWSLSFERHLACIPMKNLRILKSSDMAVTKAFLTTEPPVQLKELCINHSSFDFDNYSLLWHYLARVTSLTHLSLPHLRPPDDPPSLIFAFQELQYLEVHIALAPSFADQPMKEMKSDVNKLTASPRHGLAVVELVRHHWQGIVFPHVQYLETNLSYELDSIPFGFWREFLLNVKKVE